MSEPSRNTRTLAVAAAALAVLALVVVAILATSRPPAGGDPGPPPRTAGDPGSAGDPAAENLAAWRAAVGGTDLVIEARDARSVEGRMVLGEAPGERDGAVVHFVGVPDGTCGADEAADPRDRAVFEVEVRKPGKYFPWARVWWTDGCGNSVRVRVEREGQGPVVMERTDGNYEVWQWARLMSEDGSLDLVQGAYEVTVENREDGARVSRILLTTRPYRDYTPTSVEG